MSDIVHEAVYPHPAERVWRALTDPAAIAAWLMPNDFQPHVGHRFQFRATSAPGFDGSVDSEILEIADERRLVYSWQRGGIDTRVIWTLEPLAGATRVRLEHTGFRGMNGFLVRPILARGWKRSIMRDKLPAVLDRVRDGVALEPLGEDCTPGSVH
ncbi:MAG: SRPBCC domain-containing protein [Gemmatimonadaceae bacterium]